MRFIVLVVLACAVSGCQGDDRLVEKARIEGRETATAELQAQVDHIDQVEERAKAEGRATALAEIQTQIEHIDEVVQRARAEGRATALSEIETQIENIDQIVQRARAEGRATTLSEIETQMENLDQLVRRARAEGRAVAEAELQTQIDHLEQLVERARAEGRAMAESEISVQMANLATRSTEMEEDLAARHRFYQAVRGDYEGTLQTEQGAFRIRITLVPSLPPYLTRRIRQLEEVTADLNNLYLNAQVVQWNPVNSLSAVGCRIGNIRPDIVNGEIAIASPDCPNFYALRISSESRSQTTTESARSGSSVSALELASSIRAGQVSAVSELRGELRPSTNAAVYQLSVQRVARQ